MQYIYTGRHAGHPRARTAAAPSHILSLPPPSHIRYTHTHSRSPTQAQEVAARLADTLAARLPALQRLNGVRLNVLLPPPAGGAAAGQQATAEPAAAGAGALMLHLRSDSCWLGAGWALPAGLPLLPLAAQSLTTTMAVADSKLCTRTTHAHARAHAHTHTHTRARAPCQAPSPPWTWPARCWGRWWRAACSAPRGEQRCWGRTCRWVGEQLSTSVAASGCGSEQCAFVYKKLMIAGRCAGAPGSGRGSHLQVEGHLNHVPLK